MLKALVGRIIEDSAPPKKTLNVKKGTITRGKGSGDVGKIRIAKSWALIRFLAEDATLNAPVDIFEQECRPLLAMI